ncbi:MAG: hypothetical protein KC996_10700 [Phycisphaerales bacterium]|nr:hypothetical protein [Phycisphaerales bacterium]
MMRWILLIAMIFGFGCSEPAATSSLPSPIKTASNEDGSAVVHLYTSTNELTTMEQLGVTIELSRTPTTDAAIEPVDWEDAGWTVISRTHTPEREIADRLVTTETITLEPFLDGRYTIPSIVASAGDWKIATDPFQVTVTSVLTPDDAGEIVVTTELLPPSAPRSERRGSAMLIAVGLGMIFAGGVFWWTGRPKPASPSVREQLEQIAGGAIRDDHEALALVHRLVATLKPNDRLSRVLDACERIRYSGSAATSPIAQSLASEALEALEGV